MIPGIVSAAALAAQLALAPPGAVAHAVPASRRSAMLTAGQLFSLADRAWEQGDVRTAEAAYEALARDPSRDVRAEALFRHGRMLAKAGRLSDAAALLRALVDQRPDATVARIELARVFDLLGDKDAALRELRRAQMAGLPSSVARLVGRYSEALRASRPSGTQFEIAVAPDSNIGRATRSDTLGTIIGDFEIGEESKARSGIGLALRGQTYRRIALPGGKASMMVRLSGFGDLYRKTRFNDLALDLAVGPELRFGGNRIAVELGGTERWVGQKPFMRSARLAASWTRPLGDRSQLRLGGHAAIVDNRFNALQDGRNYAARLSIDHALSDSTGVTARLSADRHSARDAGYSTTNVAGTLAAWRALGPLTLSAEVELGRLKADRRLLLFPEKRSEEFSRFSIGVTHHKLAFGGFAPVSRLVVERNRSTIALYDYKRVRTEFGLSRAF